MKKHRKNPATSQFPWGLFLGGLATGLGISYVTYLTLASDLKKSGT